MRLFISTILLGTAAMLGGCNTVRGVGEDVESVAQAFDPNVHYAACGTYGPIDRNADGRISNSEWNDYRANYRYWDTNGDGRISRAEYSRCWYGGGFYPTYHQSMYEPSWTVFDTNGDGYISNDEYWNAQAYSSLDRNGDGVIDSTEWPW